MITLKQCPKPYSVWVKCPHSACNDCNNHYCAKWRINSSKDGIVYDCEEPTDEPKPHCFRHKAITPCMLEVEGSVCCACPHNVKCREKGDEPK